MIRITYEPEQEGKVLHLTQRNKHGGALGDVVRLNAGESAEVTLETDGVQITALEEPAEPTDEVESE